MHDYRLLPAACTIWFITASKPYFSATIFLRGTCYFFIIGVLLSILMRKIFPLFNLPSSLPVLSPTTPSSLPAAASFSPVIFTPYISEKSRGIARQIVICLLAASCACGANSLRSWQEANSLLEASAQTQFSITGKVVITRVGRNMGENLEEKMPKIPFGTRARLENIAGGGLKQRYRSEVCLKNMPNSAATESKISAPGAESVFSLRTGEELLIKGKIQRTADRYCSYTLEAEQMRRAPHPQFFRKISATLRSYFQKELQKNSLSYPALISGVVLGDDSQLEIQPQRALKKAGLAHLTAVSGAHISLLLGGVILLLGKSKPLLTAGAGTLILLQLLALVGLSPSVVRAALMGVWVLVALALERRGNSLPFLALSIMLTSLFFPEIARELGFQMSVLATLSILTLGNYLQKNLAKFYPAAIARLLAYPLAAGVATMPLVAEIQDSLSLWTVAANLAAAPVVAPFTICGLAAVLGSSLPGFPVLPLLKICSFCASWIVKVAEFACQLPAGAFPVGKNLFLHILLIFLILASTRRKAAARGII